MTKNQFEQMIKVLSTYERILEDEDQEVNCARLRVIIKFLVKNFKRTIEKEQKSLEMIT